MYIYNMYIYYCFELVVLPYHHILLLVCSLNIKCIDLEISMGHLCIYELTKRNMSKPRGSVRIAV